MVGLRTAAPLLIALVLSAVATPLRAAAAAPPAKKLDTLRVYLDWSMNVEFAGEYAALKKGWYAEEGIDPKFVFDGIEIIPNVMKGMADIGMQSGHDIIRHIGQGTKIKAFSAKYQISPDSIVVNQDSEIRAIKDLKGKRVGVFSTQEYDMFRVMLGSAGLTMQDVTFVPIKTFVETEIIALMRAKTVDAIIAWEFNWTTSFALLGHKLRVFPGYENGFHFYGITYFGPTAFVDKNRDLLRRFLRATYRGWQEVYRDPDHYAARVVDDWYPKDRYIAGSRDLTLQQQRLELRLRKKYFFEGVGRDGIGTMSRWKWSKAIEIARRAGMVPADSKLTVDDVIDPISTTEETRPAKVPDGPK